MFLEVAIPTLEKIIAELKEAEPEQREKILKLLLEAMDVFRDTVKNRLSDN